MWQSLFLSKNDSSIDIPVRFCKIFKNTLFTEQIWTTTSDYTFIERKISIFRIEKLRINALEIIVFYLEKKVFISYSLKIGKIIKMEASWYLIKKTMSFRIL